jgi:hypothetical protein
MLKQVLDVYEILDSGNVTGNDIAELLTHAGAEHLSLQTVVGAKGKTDFIKVLIPGSKGKHNGGNAPTLGIIGRLGGIGARPDIKGFVSDGDGALAAIAIALKLVQMSARADKLTGDVIVTTHICPDAPTREHYPVPFMDSPVDMQTMNDTEVSSDMDAILSIDTTKGNQVINHRGFAISPTVKEGYILKVADDVLNIVAATTGKLPQVFPLSQQDITPYGNNLYHINSILQPSVATNAPVIGVAMTTETIVAGCATGATHEVDVADVARFCIEVAKGFTSGQCQFYDKQEFSLLRKLYGDMNHFQKSS